MGVVFYANAYSGATADAKIQACVNAAVAAGGGTCDARGISSASTTQVWSTTVTVTGTSVTLLLGDLQVTPAVLPAIKVLGGGLGQQVIRVIGQGPDSTSGTVFNAPMGLNGDLIQVGDGTSGHNPANAEVAGLYLNGNSLANCIHLNYATSAHVYGNMTTGCYNFGIEAQNSTGSIIGPFNYIGTVTNTTALGGIVLDASPLTHIYHNSIYSGTYGLRFTNGASNNVVSQENAYGNAALSNTYAFELPLMAATLYNFRSESDTVTGATLGWADIGKLVDGSGANPPSMVTFKHLEVDATTAATSLTAAVNLGIEDSYIAPFTTALGATTSPVSVGITTLSLKDNVWGSGLLNSAISSSDLSAGQLTVGTMQYTQPAGTVQVGPLTASIGANGVGVTWSSPTTGVSSSTLSTVSVTNSTSHAEGDVSPGALIGTGYSFGIPVTATIVGIQATFSRYYTGFQASDGQVCIIKQGGASVCQYGHNSWTTTSATSTIGSPTSLWGGSWSATDFNGVNFGMSVNPVVGTLPPSGSTTFYLGYFQISVYYNSGGTLNVANINVPGLQNNITGPTTAAVLAATVSGGAVTGCSVTSGGAGYPSTPALVIGGNGTGAAGTLTMSGGILTACSITFGGTGYTTVSVAPQTGNYAQLFGGMIIQWATGATLSPGADGQSQIVPFSFTFPHACLQASVSTLVGASVTNGNAMFQQVGPCGVSSVTVVQQNMSSDYTGTTYTPTVIAIGW
jgi:hypothetical protein